MKPCCAKVSGFCSVPVRIFGSCASENPYKTAFASKLMLLNHLRDRELLEQGFVLKKKRLMTLFHRSFFCSIFLSGHCKRSFRGSVENYFELAESNSLISARASLIGMLAEPALFANTFTPITSPSALNSGPPEFPGTALTCD